MAHHDDDSNVLIYMLAGVGLGAIIGAAPGCFSPRKRAPNFGPTSATGSAS